ncbi:MAG: iron-sulfur cluster assembly accessory protein [Devosia sp.]|nr:iron-sulfur cluster assembly accessory protein [Devosia sp.]
MKALSIRLKSYYFSLTVLSLPNGVDIQMTEAALALPNVVLTDRAAKRVARILAKEPEGTVLRISVAGGGCSGFQYEYNLVQETPANDDTVLAKNGATVLIDAMSLEFMGGSEIDFSDDLIGQSFQIKNPNAVASCGCGTSFAV